MFMLYETPREPNYNIHPTILLDPFLHFEQRYNQLSEVNELQFTLLYMCVRQKKNLIRERVSP